MRFARHFRGTILIALLGVIASFVLPGCLVVPSTCCGASQMPQRYCVPKPCEPRYSEPQWQYLDPQGSPRLMGDSAFRDHLGLQHQPPQSSSP